MEQILEEYGISICLIIMGLVILEALNVVIRML